MSVDDTKEIIRALRERFPNIIGPGEKDICYATQNRQDAVRALAKQVQLILVIGAANSSNSNRLRDLAQSEGCASYLINNAPEINPDWLNGVNALGITAGASAPEILVEEVVDALGKIRTARVSTMDGKAENVVFKLPKEVA